MKCPDRDPGRPRQPIVLPFSVNWRCYPGNLRLLLSVTGSNQMEITDDQYIRNFKIQTREELPPGVQVAAENGSKLQISRSAFYSFQYVTVTLLVALATFHYVYADTYGRDLIMLLTRMFDPGLENSIPTAFSSLNLLISSVLLFAIYRHSKDRSELTTVYWLSLSIIFFGLSVDEVAQLHERFAKLQLYTGVLIPVIEDRSWLLYGAAFTVVVFLLHIPFLRQLNRQTMALFLLSGAIFVSGALGFEFLAAWMLYHEIVATRVDLIYRTGVIFEEGFEMYGIALFNCTLFGHVVANRVSLTLTGRP